MRRHHTVAGYIGTYYSEESCGVYCFNFNEETGEISKPELFYELQSAKWVSLYEELLVAPVEKNGRAGICLIRLGNDGVKSAYEILEEGQTPCYILQDEDYIYTANYHEGTVMVYCIEGGKPPHVVKRIENGTKAGCHQILLHDQYMLVPCLEQNRIRIFDRTQGFSETGEILFPDGSGPRHGVFNQAHTRLYVVSEWSNELFVFEVQGRDFKLIQTMTTLPKDEKGKNVSGEAAAAAIRLTGDERFLYISLRGQDLLSVLDVSGDKAVMLQHVSCGGNHPRDFILSGDERFIIVVNRFGGGIVSLARDVHSGLIGGICGRAEIPEAVSVVLEHV